MAKYGLSIVITTCSEKKDGFLSQMAKEYPKNSDIEYIVVDTGSCSSIFDSLKRDDFSFFSLKNANRAQRLALGFSQAKTSMVLFNHPRSIIEPAGIDYLLTHGEGLGWGGFTHQFDKEGWGYQWTSWYSNKVRPKVLKVVYLDHSIFFQRHLLDRPIPSVPIFEDTEISKILAVHGKPKILPFVSRTSSIRFETNGFWRQAIMNQAMKLGYHLGFSGDQLNRIYEKNIKLNE